MSERLPLGVDLGESRVRVASLVREGASVQLVGVGCADVTGSLEEALAAALREVDPAPKNAVTMIRTCDARLRTARFPALSRRETFRAAYFEGIASFANASEPIAVRSTALRHECGEDRMLIAATPVATVRRVAAVLKSAGLRSARIDHEGCVLARACQGSLLDIGYHRSTLVTVSGGIPVTRTITLGGADFTSALADELGIDIETAEIRKRTIGLGGAASAAVDAFCAALASEIAALREDEGASISALHLCGNGARLAEIVPALEQRLRLTILPVRLEELLAAQLPHQAATFTAMDSFTAIAAALPSRPFVRAAA